MDANQLCVKSTSSSIEDLMGHVIQMKRHESRGKWMPLRKLLMLLPPSERATEEVKGTIMIDQFVEVAGGMPKNRLRGADNASSFVMRTQQDIDVILVPLLEKLAQLVLLFDPMHISI